MLSAFLIFNCAFQPLGAVEFTASRTIAGRTPQLVGCNSGHFMPGSNTLDWWRYLGVNAARVWSPGETVEGCGKDDMPPFGDGVGSAEEFVDRRHRLRQSPLSSEFIKWKTFEDHFANRTTDGNRVRLDYALSSLQKLGIETVIVIGASARCRDVSRPGDSLSWAERWEYWQHCYAQAFHVARHFGVQRFHLFNEPDHPSQTITQEAFLESLQIGSDAIQSAVEDVNRLFDRKLVAQVHAPVTAGSIGRFWPDGRKDSRDKQVGWGELVVRNQREPLLPGIKTQFPLFQTYAYQEYGKSGKDFANNLAAVKESIEGFATSPMLNIALTEFNVQTAANFAAMSETADSPRIAAELGSILINLANERADELYLFKFSQTANFRGNEIKRNGILHVDNDNAPYNIGGATRSAEVYRLFVQGFAGGHDLLGLPIMLDAEANEVTWAFSHHPKRQQYYAIASNTSEKEVPVVLDIFDWQLPEGAGVVAYEVSSRKRGEVSVATTISPDKRLSLQLPSHSITMVRVSQIGRLSSVTVPAADDAMVKSGVNINTNYGQSARLWVKNNSTNPSARNVAYVKFALGAAKHQMIDRAILRLRGRNSGTGRAVAHVYGVEGDYWDEKTITWRTAPNLAPCLRGATSISDNCVVEAGKTARILGQITAGVAQEEMAIDVTNFVREQNDGLATFLIARDVRFDGEDISDERSALAIASSERGAGLGPQLQLFLRDGLESHRN